MYSTYVCIRPIKLLHKEVLYCIYNYVILWDMTDLPWVMNRSRYIYICLYNTYIHTWGNPWPEGPEGLFIFLHVYGVERRQWQRSHSEPPTALTDNEVRPPLFRTNARTAHEPPRLLVWDQLSINKQGYHTCPFCILCTYIHVHYLGNELISPWNLSLRTMRHYQCHYLPRDCAYTPSVSTPSVSKSNISP